MDGDIEVLIDGQENSVTLNPVVLSLTSSEKDKRTTGMKVFQTNNPKSFAGSKNDLYKLNTYLDLIFRTSKC